MKLVDAQKQAERIRRLEQWRPWFAWHPVRLSDTGDVVWWEPVERRQEFISGYDGTYVFDRYRRAVANKAG